MCRDCCHPFMGYLCLGLPMRDKRNTNLAMYPASQPSPASHVGLPCWPEQPSCQLNEGIYSSTSHIKIHMMHLYAHITPSYCPRRLTWLLPTLLKQASTPCFVPSLLQLVSPAVAVSLVVAMGLALALTGAALLLCLEYMPDIPSR